MRRAVKIHIDPRDLAATPTEVDIERTEQLIVTALMLAGHGAGAAALLTAALGTLAERSDARQCVLEMAIRCLSVDLAPDPGWKERVLAAIDEIEKGRTS